MEDLPSGLAEAIEKFWDANSDLKAQVLRDWYVRGYVQHTTDDAGRAAVEKWLTAHQSGGGA